VAPPLEPLLDPLPVPLDDPPVPLLAPLDDPLLPLLEPLPLDDPAEVPATGGGGPLGGV